MLQFYKNLTIRIYYLVGLLRFAMPHHCIYCCIFKSNTASVICRFFMFMKPSLGEVAVDMLTFAVVSPSPNQVMVFCVMTANRIVANVLMDKI